MLDFVYACIQLIHNLGAATVVGSPAAALWLARDNQPILGRLALLVAAGWLVQGATGAGFGLASYFLRGEIPEVTGMALIALTIKIGSTVGGITLALLSIKSTSSNKPCPLMFRALLALGVLSLCAAAFLRWYL